MRTAKSVDISYIVSCFGRPELLPCLLWSLKAQAHRDFEVIVTDNTVDSTTIAEHKRNLANLKDSRFRYINTSGKIKVSDCYWSAEYGMKLATGRWLCFPCEDCYYPDRWGQWMLGAAVTNGWDLVLCERNETGPEPCGAGRYFPIQMGTMSFPGYKPSFLVKASIFPGWLNKPTVGACSGVDRTTLQYMVRDPKIKWGVVRDLYYAHN
jgi:glycosyltransferase involved in cell wall biosynthesis